MDAGTHGWVELVLFYGFALGFAAWQYIATDRRLKRTRAENAAKQAAEKDPGPSA